MPAASGASGPTTVSATGALAANATRSASAVLGNIGEPGLARRAGVARRDEHLRDARRLRDLPGQRVLASAATDDEYVHAGIRFRPEPLVHSIMTRPKTYRTLP